MKSPQTSRRGPSIFLLGLALGLLIAAVYGRAATYDFIRWDDQQHLANNPFMHPPSWEHIAVFWHRPYFGLYVPVTYTLWSLVAMFAQVPGQGGKIEFNPYLFHTVNIAAHFIAALLVWRIVYRLVGDRYIAWIGAAVFALHPLCVEPVVWVSGFRDLLSACLGFAAILAYLPGREHSTEEDITPSSCTQEEGRGSLEKPEARSQKPEFSSAFSVQRSASTNNPHPTPPPVYKGREEERRGRMVGRYLLATIFYLLAILSKPAAVAILPMVLVLDVIWLRRRWMGIAWRLLPWAAAAVVLAVMTHRIQGLPPAIDTPVWWQRPMIAGDAVTFYLQKAVAPVALCVQYDHAPHRVLDRGMGITPTMIALAAGLAIFGLGFRWRWVWLCGALFLAGLLPVLGFVPFYFQYFSTTADRYAYFSLLAVALAIAFVLREWDRAGLFYFFATCIAALAIISFLQVGTWRSTEAVFRHVLAINLHSNLALVKLSREKLIEGDPLSAEQLARRALEARPDDSRAWINLGAALENLHHPGEAKKCYEHVVETDQSRDAAGAYSNLAAMNADAGDYGDAIKLYHEALSHDPDLIEAQIGLAEAERGER
ncbi:MAG TPA: tetratricopeptide repeat protein [Tepidisphaeraceae bacterium]|jgi:hypothetical protein